MRLKRVKHKIESSQIEVLAWNSGFNVLAWSPENCWICYLEPKLKSSLYQWVWNVWTSLETLFRKMSCSVMCSFRRHFFFFFFFFFLYCSGFCHTLKWNSQGPLHKKRIFTKALRNTSISGLLASLKNLWWLFHENWRWQWWLQWYLTAWFKGNNAIPSARSHVET